MSSSENNQNQATCEKSDEKLSIGEKVKKDEKEIKAGKSNSELMAEFFAITEDDKNK